MQYRCNPAGQLQAVTDPNGNTLQLTYGASGAPSSLTDTAGRTWSTQTDASGRIISVTDPAARSVTYQYSVSGDLVQVTDALGKLTQYAYDEHGSLPRVLRESNAGRSQLYGLGGDILWNNTSDQGLLYLHQDALGSTIALTKPDGSLAGTQSYDAFGATRSTTGITAGSFWFAGEQVDAETGLIYLRARYYDPSTGRFLQADPAAPNLKDTQSLDSYVYARNNPLRLVDPCGEASIQEDVANNLGTLQTAYNMAPLACGVGGWLESHPAVRH